MIRPSRLSTLRAGCAIAALMLIAACSKDKEIDPPAELVDIKPQLTIQKRWSASLGGDSERLRLALKPFVLGDRVFSASYDGEVAAFTADRGKRLWLTKTKAKVSAGPAANEDIVLVGTADGEVIALSAADGKQRWRQQLTSEVLAPPLVTNDFAVVRTVDGGLHELTLTDGTIRWTYSDTMPRLSLRGTAPPVLAGDAVIAGFDNGKVVSIDLQSGDVLWETLVSAPRGRTELERLVDIDAPAQVVGDDIFVVSFQGRIAMLARESGQIWWARDASSYRGFAMDDELIYLTDADSVILAMRKRDGNVEWEQPAMRRRSLTAPAIDGDALVVGDFEGYLHWVDRQTGEIIARTKTGGERITNAPVSTGELVYVQTDDGKLLALKSNPVKSRRVAQAESG
jgi:outer membrane protein assembly factor BamB